MSRLSAHGKSATKPRELRGQPPAPYATRDPISALIVVPTLDVGAADASVRNAFALMRLAREHHSDLIHAHGRAAAWSALLAARLNGIPFVTTWYKGFREQNVFKRLYNCEMARGDRVITVSEHLAQLVNDRYGTPWECITVLPTSIDFERFDPAHVACERVEALRRSWGIRPKTKVILVVGRIVRRKGHHVVVRAAQRLKRRASRISSACLSARTAATPTTPANYGIWCWRRRPWTWLRMAAPLHDMPAAYATAAVVESAAVQPEGLQRAILEAQAMARPVIVCDLGDGPDVVLKAPAVPDGRVTGLGFAAGDDAALAEALVGFFSMPEPTRRAIGTRAAMAGSAPISTRQRSPNRRCASMRSQPAGLRFAPSPRTPLI
jgi:glycosyltransferase involved in cell wall biosynthesis